jgi:hypothetical protein
MRTRFVPVPLARIHRSAAVALFAGVLAMGCGTRGSGTRGSEDRDVPAFQGVDVGGVFTLEASEGTPAAVRIEGDVNLLPYVETTVEGGILYVKTSRRIAPQMPLVVRVTTPELREVDVGGAADATIATAQPRFELEVSGASEVAVRGSTEHFELDVSGASNVDAKALTSRHVEADVSGASQAHVTATHSLDAEASGASTITYGGGAPEVKRDASGASKIVARSDAAP